MTQKYTGGCQCCNIRFEVTLDLGTVIACNCSRCSKLGSLLAFAPAGSFTLQSGADAMSEFQFNKHVIHHFFCKTCGIQSFARGKRPGDGAEMVAVNARCLDGVDIDSLTIKTFDGRSV